MLGYEYLDLSPVQVGLRRKALDNVGFQAWLSPIAVLLAVYIARKVLPGRATGAVGAKPVSKAPSKFQSVLRRISWFLNNTILPEYGPIQVQVAGLMYLGWLFYLIYKGTGNDYMHLTKAFGHVAVSQLPWLYLMSFKSPLSPIQMATGLTHERLNAFHRFFGRVIHGLVATHAVMYIRFFMHKDLMSKRIQDRDVRLGMTAFWLVNFLDIFAVPPFRKFFYHKVFYRSHVTITALLVPVLFFHVPYTRPYVVQAGIFWLASGYLRRSATTKTKVRCAVDQGTDVVKVKFQVDEQSPLAAWVPGQHVYLSKDRMSSKNPFTVANFKHIPERKVIDMQLVAKPMMTGRQVSFLESMAKDKKELDFLVEGPYGEAAAYMPSLVKQGKEAGETLVVSGGVGATYGLPIYLTLLEARGETAGLKMVWLIRTAAEAAWGLELLEQATNTVDVDIYITQSAGKDISGLRTVPGVTIHNNGKRPDFDTVIDPIFSPKIESNGHANGHANGSLVKGDPRKIKKSYEKVTVLVCGPEAMSKALRSEVGKHVMGYGREVAWYEEAFGFGGQPAHNRIFGYKMDAPQ